MESAEQRGLQDSLERAVTRAVSQEPVLTKSKTTSVAKEEIAIRAVPINLSW